MFLFTVMYSSLLDFGVVKMANVTGSEQNHNSERVLSYLVYVCLAACSAYGGTIKGVRGLIPEVLSSVACKSEIKRATVDREDPLTRLNGVTNMPPGCSVVVAGQQQL